jgi:hypothetical protein
MTGSRAGAVSAASRAIGSLTGAVSVLAGASGGLVATARRHGRALALCAALALGSSVADGAEYEVFVAVESEDELYDLLEQDQISEDTFNTLVELLRRGVDLDTASREELYSLPNLDYAEVDAILAYRAGAGRIDDPAALVAAGALSERELVAIAPFLVVRAPATRALDVTGSIRAPGVWVAGTEGPPPGAIQARLAIEDFDLGLAAFTTHNRIGDVRYDPSRLALSAEPAATRFALPKWFVAWRGDRAAAIIGTYRIGFGQRLTFDNTDRYTPSGVFADDTVFRGTELSRACRESLGEQPSPCGGDERYVYATPDFRWRESLRGIAAGIDRLALDRGWLQAYGWASYETKSIYQYELYDRAACPDPRDDDDAACAAPAVFVRRDDLLAPTTRLSFSTLPDMYAEALAGASVTYHRSPRARLGITAYGAAIDWLTDGIDLDFQEWSRTPFGGEFGAIGVHGAWGRGRADLYAELARSFDRQPGGGGDLAALVRAVATFPDAEVEGSLRYYGAAFANPYARPISQPDETDGLRARDETGARLRYTGEVEGLDLRAQTDLWLRASDASAAQSETLVRGDYDIDRRHRAGLWLAYRNEDLTDDRSDGPCFEAPVEDDDGEPTSCAGHELQATLRYRYQPYRELAVATQLQLDWLDDARDELDDELRKDLSLWATVSAWPTDAVRARLRARYRHEDACWSGDEPSANADERDAAACLADLVTGGPDDRGERSLWTYLDLAYRLDHTYRVRGRYDLYWRLDDRDSTAQREPNPEHWLWLELDARF